MANSVHFQRLALFICHLFNDGHFRSAHILYKPDVFDFDFITQLNLNCPGPMPFYLTDVSQPWHWPWTEQESLHTVLQLHFFEFTASELKKDFSEMGRKGFAPYQVFAFDSIDSHVERNQDAALRTVYWYSRESRPMILNYNPENVSVYIDRGSLGKLNQRPFMTFNQTTDFDGINLFDSIFGEYRRMHSLIIDSLEIDGFYRIYHTDYITNFYHMHLNNSCMRKRNQLFVTDKTIKTKYYKEMFRHPMQIDGQTS